MYRRIIITVLFLVLYPSATRYAGDFQDLGVGARALGMGSAVVAQFGDPFILYWNPAGTAGVAKRTINFMHAENFGGAVKNEYLGLVWPDQENSLGAGYYYLGVPSIKLTRLPDTLKEISEENRPIPYDTVTASDHLLFFNYSRGRGRLSFGANLKVYYRNLSVVKGFGGGADAGVISHLPNLNVALVIRDFILSPILWDNGLREQILPRFTLGVAPCFEIRRWQSSLRLEWDIVKYLDNGDKFIQNLGLEFAYHSSLFARLGLNDFKPALGLGLGWRRFSIDYAFVYHPELGASNRISAGVLF